MRLLHVIISLLAGTLVLPCVQAQSAQNEFETIDASSFRLALDEAFLEISMPDPALLAQKELFLEWINYSVITVQHYYGRFPVSRLKLLLVREPGVGVKFGRAFGGETPFIRIVIGERVDATMLARDWILVHEMVHLAMADVPRSNRWLLEGLATYVESIARAQLGHLSEAFVWTGFIQRMPQGLPSAGDRGLDYTPTWGRTYWGGALFCLRADIEIRRLSNNRLSLQDALRGTLKAGYSMQSQQQASAREIFAAADAATGLPVLVKLYDEMRAAPAPVDLEVLWKLLGVSLQDDQIHYDDSAELAHVRAQMLKP